MEDSIILMEKKAYFSKIDLSNGFNQIKIDDENKKYTSFFLLGQQWQYKRIPFGIESGPKLFQRYIANILGEIQNVFVYIDDIIIFSKSTDDHNKTLLRVLQRLYE